MVAYIWYKSILYYNIFHPKTEKKVVSTEKKVGFWVLTVASSLKKVGKSDKTEAFFDLFLEKSDFFDGWTLGCQSKTDFFLGQSDFFLTFFDFFLGSREKRVGLTAGFLDLSFGFVA